MSHPPLYLLSIVSAAVFAATASFAQAGEADVANVSVTKTGEGTFSFEVSVLHEDAGWDHYADRWEVVGPTGEIYATRKLAHPHVDEQPFTRSLGSVDIPVSIRVVHVRAHDSVHGHGGVEKEVDVPH